jgi:V8-like Glu-specific endopeptidase
MLGPTSVDAAGEDFNDAWGRRWIAVGEVVPQEIDVGGMEERINADYLPPPEPDPQSLSVEELAEKLRPRRLVGGYEYRLEQPDYIVAEKILAMVEPPSTVGFQPTEAPGARFVIGPDDRMQVRDTRTYPASANAYLSQNCTATMIGPSTALCAAHCFYQNGSWIESRSITFGAQIVAPTAPFGSFLADSVTIPNAWITSSTASVPQANWGWDWDFAVLEFSPTRPDIGRLTGWLGVDFNNLIGFPHIVIGYPLDKQPFFPTSWIKSGIYTATPGSRYEHNIDIVSGDSGAGAYFISSADGMPYCSGIQSTQQIRTNPARTWNEVRRWDTTTYNFFREYGNWPRP